MTDQFDISFLVRQSGLLVALAYLPLFAVAGSSPKRRGLVPLILVCALVGWALVFYSAVGAVGRYLPDEVPYKPFRIGPSVFGLWGTARLLALVFWAPILGAYLLLRTMKWFRPRYGLVVGTLLCGAIVATTVAWWASLEDTFTTPAFSWRSWNAIQPGMPRPEVHALLGPPIPAAFQPAFARGQDTEFWVVNLSRGYAAAVWFEQDRVKTARLWYSD